VGEPTGRDARPTPSALVVVGIVAVASGVGQGFGRFMFPTLLPAMKRDLVGSYSGAGFLGTANVAAYLAGAVVVMFASLRRPADQILKVGLILSTAAMFTLATARGMPQLVVGMVCAGVGGACIFVPSPGLAASVFAPGRRGVAVGVVNAGIGAAIVAGTQLSRVAERAWGPGGWRWVWTILGATGLVTAVAAFGWLHPPSTTRSGPPRLAALREVPSWRAYSAGYFLFGFGYIVVITYTVAALRDDAGFSAGHAANVYALLGVGTLFGGVGLGWLSDRWGRRAALAVGYLGCALCPLVLLAHREPWAALSSLAFGALFSGSVAVVAAYLTDHTSAADFGAAFGAATVAFGAAQAFGPQVGGWLADQTGSFTAVLVMAAGVLGVAAATTAALAGSDPTRRSAAGPAESSLNAGPPRC
jgi:predicted MFS family arabinose efflux permease